MQPIPDDVRGEVEAAVAEALNLDDVGRAVGALLPVTGAPVPDEDEVDLVVTWVWLTRSHRWPASLTGDEERRSLLNGSIVSALLAHDLFRGRQPGSRDLKPHQRHWLEHWESQTAG